MTHWTVTYARRLLATKTDTATGSESRLSLARRYADARAWSRGSQDRIDADIDACADLHIDALRDLTRKAEKDILATIRLYSLPNDHTGDSDPDETGEAS